MVGILSRPDAAELLTDDDRPDTEALRTEATALRARLDELATGFADGVVTRSQFRTATSRAKAKLATAEAQMADAGRVNVLGPWCRLPMSGPSGRRWAPTGSVPSSMR